MTHENEQVGSICTYRINADDQIISVGENWEAFAAENDAPDACFAPHIIGSSIWDHIKDPETLHIYKALVAKVRYTLQPVTLPLRCDAPDLKRYLEITLTPEQENDVSFQSKTIRVESRPINDLLDTCKPRSDELVRICSFCKKIDIGGDQWVATEIAVALKGYFNQIPLPRLTHSVCPVCYDIWAAELQ